MMRSRLPVLMALAYLALVLGFGCVSEAPRLAEQAGEVEGDDPCGGLCGPGQKCCKNNCSGGGICSSVKCPLFVCAQDDVEDSEAAPASTSSSEPEESAEAIGQGPVDPCGGACGAGLRCCVGCQGQTYCAVGLCRATDDCPLPTE